MRRLFALGLACLALVVLAPGAWAKPLTETFTRKKATETFPELDPCLGQVTVTLTFNEVVHVTELTDGPNAGTFHFTFTQAGKFLVDPDDPALPDFTGSFAVWGGFNGNRSNAAGTFTFNAVGSGDGLRIRFHAIEHFSVSASGIENAFFFETIDCPV